LFEKQVGGNLRRIVETLLIIGGLALGLAAAHGGDYPSRRITLIAPWPPAGAIDTTCRELAPGVTHSARSNRVQTFAIV
jgi:tripartite-type tricarboxylate transporter receptor subunit TctC